MAAGPGMGGLRDALCVAVYASEQQPEIHLAQVPILK